MYFNTAATELHTFKVPVNKSVAAQLSLCLDVEGDGTAAGTLVVAHTCNYNTNEQWALNQENLGERKRREL
ncbi:MAG: RICIN domain-containing protein [Terracidiphilus sp.]